MEEKINETYFAIEKTCPFCGADVVLRPLAELRAKKNIIEFSDDVNLNGMKAYVCSNYFNDKCDAYIRAKEINGFYYPTGTLANKDLREKRYLLNSLLYTIYKSKKINIINRDFIVKYFFDGNICYGKRIKDSLEEMEIEDYFSGKRIIIERSQVKTIPIKQKLYITLAKILNIPVEFANPQYMDIETITKAISIVTAWDKIME